MTESQKTSAGTANEGVREVRADEQYERKVSVSQLSLSYTQSDGKSLAVLDNLSFDAKHGSYISIIGPSGCGKSTLLLCLSGLLDCTGGTISLGGLSPDAARRNHKIGFVFQKPVFFEWQSISENISLPARISRKSVSTQMTDARLKEFGLDRFSKSYPHELSGGMLSRASLVRALQHDPDFLFLDEAFNHLDEALREEINLSILSTWVLRQLTVIAITHSISEAVFMSDRVFLMSHKPSSIIRTFDVPFPRPRETAIRSNPNFQKLVQEIRAALRATYHHAKEE